MREPQKHGERSRFDRREGFSLVELIVVIAVVGILSVVIGTTVSGVNNDTRLANAGAHALADVRYAQEMAMSHRREVDVLVYPSTESYEVKWHDTGAFVPSSLDESNDCQVNFNQGEYHDVVISSSGLGGRLSFTATGTPLINGAPLTSEKMVLTLNGRIFIVVFPSGYAEMGEVVGASGC
jgi:prepilin-type N-terminal cleavage/methylation domain-containing protein